MILKALNILIIFFVIFCSMLLVGCSSKTTVVNTNSFYQTDYDYFCFDGTKTWSQIVACLKAETEAEHAQNKITNELIDKSN